MTIDTFKVALYGQEHEIDVPQLAPGSVPPGGFLDDSLALFQSFKGRYPLWDMAQCVEQRNEVNPHFFQWAPGNYTWNQFLRENNFLSWQGAIKMVTLLLGRDILAETEGGLFGTVTEKMYLERIGVPSLQFYFTALLRVAARFDWWARAQEKGIPDRSLKLMQMYAV